MTWQAFEDAKRAVSVHDLFERYFGQRPGNRAVCSPFRADRHPSFQVRSDGFGWVDYAGDSGDAVTFIERAEGCSRADAMRRLVEFAGGHLVVATALPRPAAAVRKPGELHRPPALCSPSAAQLEQLLALRGWSHCPLDGLQWLVDQQMLFVCLLAGVTHWAITDPSRRNLQVRRLDGKPLEWVDRKTGERRQLKAKTWPGSEAAHLIGSDDLCYDGFIWVEGGPDLLAAAILACRYGVEQRVGLLCQTGAGQRSRVSLGDAPCLAFQHNDHCPVNPRDADHLLASGGQTFSANVKANAANVRIFRFRELSRKTEALVPRWGDLADWLADEPANDRHLRTQFLWLGHQH